MNTKVTIKVMNLRWLLNRNKNFMDFVPILNTYNRDNLYKTEFMKSLTDEFWMNYLKGGPVIINMSSGKFSTVLFFFQSKCAEIGVCFQ